MEHYKSTTELRNNFMSNKVKSQALRVYVGNLNVGDTLIVTSQLQVTNDLSVNVHFACQLIIDDSETGVEEIACLNRYGTLNVTPDMHHYTVRPCAIHTVESAVQNAWVKLIGWSEQGLSIDQGRGQLDVLIDPA